MGKINTSWKSTTIHLKSQLRAPRNIFVGRWPNNIWKIRTIESQLNWINSSIQNACNLTWKIINYKSHNSYPNRKRNHLYCNDRYIWWTWYYRNSKPIKKTSQWTWQGKCSNQYQWKLNFYEWIIWGIINGCWRLWQQLLLSRSFWYKSNSKLFESSLLCNYLII